MQRAGSTARMPWWFWFAAVFGMFSFIPLLIAGFKIKNHLWVALGGIQLMWFWFGRISNLFAWVSIGLAIYVFTTVRRQYLTELEIENAMDSQQHVHRRNQAFVPESATPIKSWSCAGCGAENSNAEGLCEYCGVSMPRN